MVNDRKLCDNFSDCEDNAKLVMDWHLAGLGETVERGFECKVCDRVWREVWIYSCQIDDDTEEMLTA